MSNEFDPEKIRRWEAYRNGIKVDVVLESDYDQLLALYRQLQQSTAMLEKLYAERIPKSCEQSGHSWVLK